MRLAPPENPLSVRSHCGLKSTAVKGLRESLRTLDSHRFKLQELASMNRKRAKTGGGNHYLRYVILDYEVTKDSAWNF